MIVARHFWSRFSLTNTEVRQLLKLMPKMLQQNPYTMLEHEALPQPDPHHCPYPINVACSPRAYYRTYDGRCNNLLRPLWGSSHQPLARFLPPDYADGKAAVTTTIRLRFDCHSIALRPLDNLRYGRAAPLRPK